MKLITYRNPLDTIFEEAFEAFAPFFKVQQSKSETALEWFEDDANFYARLDLPGVPKEELGLEVEADLITLKFSGSGNERKLRIPEDIVSEGITAKLEHGILTLKFPKTPEKKPVSIIIS